jgi:ketol-acid reductoisomerase
MGDGSDTPPAPPERGRISAEGDKRTARVAMFGYGLDARDQAVRLRAIGWQVDVVVRPGGMSWIRSMADGFRPMLAGEAVARASIVSVHVPEAEQPTVWAYGIAPHLVEGTLVVFAHGSALYSGAIEPEPGFDVVLLTRLGEGAGGSRVAVTHNASGRALERAAAFARDVFGASKVGTTTLESEVHADLSKLIAKVGGLTALLAEWDRVLLNPSHEPDEATLRYYERLRAIVCEGLGSGVFSKPPSSSFNLMGVARNRGAA